MRTAVTSSDAGPVLAVLGEALIDLVEHGDDEPRLARPGGSPYNVALGLARLGRHAAFVGRLSRDPLGTLLRRHAERSGVDLSRSIEASEPTTVALVELSGSSPSYRFGVDGTADFAFTDAELAHAADGAQLLHFGSLTSWTPPGDTAVARLVERVREQVLVTYDPNVRPQLQPDIAAARARVEASLACAHLVKTSDEDVAHLYPGADVADVAQEWLGAGPSLVVVTRGAEGSSAFVGGRRLDRTGRPTTVVDTVGAGDAFMSGLLDALVAHRLTDRARLADVRDDVLDAVLGHAMLIASITCSRAGANPPRRAELPR